MVRKAMIQIEVDAVINCTPEEVFDALADLEAYNAWMPGTGLFRESRQTSRGRVGVGTTFTDKIRHGTAQGEVVDYERPRRLGFRQNVRIFGMNVLESRPRYTLEAEEGGTRLHHTAEGDGRGLFRLLEFALARVARAERLRTVAALKNRLESGPRP